MQNTSQTYQVLLPAVFRAGWPELPARTPCAGQVTRAGLPVLSPPTRPAPCFPPLCFPAAQCLSLHPHPCFAFSALPFPVPPVPWHRSALQDQPAVPALHWTHSKVMEENRCSPSSFRMYLPPPKNQPTPGLVKLISGCTGRKKKTSASEILFDMAALK